MFCISQLLKEAMRSIANGKKIVNIPKPDKDKLWFWDTLKATGLEPLCHTSFSKLNHGLLTTFAERWHPETSTIFSKEFVKHYCPHKFSVESCPFKLSAKSRQFKMWKSFLRLIVTKTYINHNNNNNNNHNLIIKKSTYV
jgi:hypothetical protein